LSRSPPPAALAATRKPCKFRPANLQVSVGAHADGSAKAATSIFFMLTNLSYEPGLLMRSARLAGTSCQLTPNLSAHQPHCSASGMELSCDQYVSSSAWSAHSTMSETPKLKVKPWVTAPESMAANHWSRISKSPYMTEPADAASVSSG